MHESKKEKYLGDIIESKGTQRDTIKDRKAKGYGIVRDILAILKVNEFLTRALLQAHPKIPLEFLYLETGAAKIKHIISSRRLIYLQRLLKREDEELRKRILCMQETNPCAGDFIMLVKDNFTKI